VLPGATSFGNTIAIVQTQWGSNLINDQPDFNTISFATTTKFIQQGDRFKNGDGNQISNAENQPLVLKSSVSLDSGSILTAHVGAGGSGYAPGDTGTINSTNGNATYQVSTVGGGGAVSTFTITDGGDLPTSADYYVGQAYTTTVSTGSGDGNFTVIPDTITHGNGSAKLFLEYIIFPTS
jgi:hypothetical protein